MVGNLLGKWRIFLCVALVWFSGTANASFHLWQINEVYSNVSGTIQFIEFTTTFNGQDLMNGHTLTSSNGMSTQTFIYPNNLNDSATANKKFLMATSGFAALGIVAPDYIIPNGFLYTTNLTLNFSGFDSLSNLTLPTDGILSLNRNGTTGTNSPTNFAGATGTIVPPSPPGAPTIGTATRGNAQASIAFTPPASNGGAAITSYTATCTPGNISANGTGSPIVVTGLTNGTAYSCSVRATNSAGTGAASATVAVTPATVPGAPGITGATPGNGSGTFSISAPASDGGSAITGYAVRCTAQGQVTQTVTGAMSPITVSGLVNGVAYDCSAYAENSVGAGPFSSSVALMPVGVPAAPTIGTASAGVGQASVSFTPPSNNGGSVILSYTATCGGQSATGPASPLTVMGLAPGVAVTCTVIATNAQGNSPPSAASNSITPPNVPGAPTLNSAVPGDTQITALFSPPASDGGSAITLYTVTCTAAMQPTRSNTGTASPIAVSALTNEVAYACSVAATNAVGSGSASNTVMVTPSATAPLALIAVQSRKTHAAAGTFDLAVDTVPVITGAVTVESRAIGAGHSIVFLFNKTITATGTASAVDTMAATIGSASATMAGNEVVVALTGVPDNRRATVSLDGVNGEVNNFPVSVGFLVGDVNNTRSVNASDISGVKARSGQTTSAANFKFDLNASGGINATDISAVKARSGLVLP
jgi:hypothetical protein